MTYSIKVTGLFEKEFKKLTKRHKSAKEDIQAVVQSILIFSQSTTNLKNKLSQAKR